MAPRHALSGAGQQNRSRRPPQRLPILYLFDANGRIHARHDGLYSLRILERMAQPLLPAAR